MTKRPIISKTTRAPSRSDREPHAPTPPPPPGFRPARFGFDESPSWLGYTDGRTWNGWACPLLPEASAREALQWLATTENGFYREAHAPRGRAFLLRSTTTDDELETFEPDQHGLYHVGAAAWVWTEREPACSACGSSNLQQTPDEETAACADCGEETTYCAFCKAPQPPHAPEEAHASAHSFGALYCDEECARLARESVRAHAAPPGEHGTAIDWSQHR